MNNKKDGKITLGMLKGKPITTSVPSITIKFHANAEEDVYGINNDDDDDDDDDGDVISTNESISTVAGSSETENTTTNSPLKLLPRLVKRSASIDISQNNTLVDTSPDPWRFFSDIKGKITKSVEDKLTEIKSRNQENDGSTPSKKIQTKEENSSSISDSEDLSESSISRTCGGGGGGGGVGSTTEGVEMSTDDDDDDTPSLGKDKNPPSPIASSLRQRFGLLKNNKSPQTEGAFSKTTLSQLYNINNTDEHVRAEASIIDNNEEEIEHGIDALETETSELLKYMAESIENINVKQDDIVNIEQINGEDVKFYENKTIFAPIGFVDFRQQQQQQQEKPQNSHHLIKYMFLIIISILFLYLMKLYSDFLTGLLGGLFMSIIFVRIKQLVIPAATLKKNTKEKRQFFQWPTIKEHQPLVKHQGWVNEYPEFYNPHTYHISRTQSVYLKLQGNFLRISHARNKVGKRALWNEGKILPIFTHHRIYNLSGAKVLLLPNGLAKKRHWSKKYPICIVLNKDQVGCDTSQCEEQFNGNSTREEKIEKVSSKFRRTFHLKKKKSPAAILRFSKLTEEEEEEEEEMNSDNSSPPSPELLSDEPVDVNSIPKQSSKINEEIFLDASTTTDEQDKTKIYIFGRTDRDKEDWYRRLTTATHATTVDNNTTTILLDNYVAMESDEYIKYTVLFSKLWKRQKESSSSIDDYSDNMLWLNGFIGRILFDLLHNQEMTRRVKDRIERKLSALKLPYFIEQLLVTDLNLGQMPLIVHRASKPILNDKGIWIDLDITYEGLVELELQTNLNLMKLKQHSERNATDHNERSAMFNSDIDDSAESSSDDDFDQVMTSSSNLDTNSKKFIKMVDRIAESKIFQAATENRYIKKAMENVSNTDLRLKVQLKELNGCLVVNVPLPPSDRVWLGFRPLPELDFSAYPIVGEKNINFLKVSNWIEKKLLLEFQKLLVLPNMEDFIIPVMSQNLPD